MMNLIFRKDLAIVNLKKETSAPTESCALEKRVLNDLIIARLTSTVLVPMIRMILFVFLLITFVRKVGFCYVSINIVTKGYFKIFKRFYFVILIKILIFMLGKYSCGGTTEYPDCSFCPIDKITNTTGSCNGNCRLNSHNNLCEFKGMVIANVNLTHYIRLRSNQTLD